VIENAMVLGDYYEPFVEFPEENPEHDEFDLERQRDMEEQDLLG
jgi:hypothetical protein